MLSTSMLTSNLLARVGGVERVRAAHLVEAAVGEAEAEVADAEDDGRVRTVDDVIVGAAPADGGDWQQGGEGRAASYGRVLRDGGDVLRAIRAARPEHFRERARFGNSPSKYGRRSVRLGRST